MHKVKFSDKVTLYLWIPEEIKLQLRICAAEKGIKVSEVAIQAFEDYLTRYQKKKARKTVLPLTAKEGIA